MALSENGSLGCQGTNKVGSAQSKWKVLHTNAKVTAQTTTDVNTIDQAGAAWFRVGEFGTTLRLRNAYTGSAPTAGKVSVFVSDGDDDPVASGAKVARVLGDTALSYTTNATQPDDTIACESTSVDLLGHSWVLVVVTEASNAGTTAVIEGKLLN